MPGLDISAIAHWTDGEDLAQLLGGSKAHGPVLMEYAAEGSIAPLVAIRADYFKLTVCEKDPPLLFDLRADPHELSNLAGDPAHTETLDALLSQVHLRWNQSGFAAQIREVRPVDGSSIPHCGKGPTIPGAINLCRKPPSDTCAIIWI